MLLSLRTLWAAPRQPYDPAGDPGITRNTLGLSGAVASADIVFCLAFLAGALEGESQREGTEIAAGEGSGRAGAFERNATTLSHGM